MLSLPYCESLGLDCNISPLMDIKMGVHVVASCWEMCVVRGVFAGIHPCVYVCVQIMSLSIFACASHVPLPRRQASGPSVNSTEFMDQQALYPAMSGNNVIELNYHFDTCRKSTKSPGCSDYFAGTLHVMTSMAERLPKLVHHTDRSPQTALDAAV